MLAKCIFLFFCLVCECTVLLFLCICIPRQYDYLHIVAFLVPRRRVATLRDATLKYDDDDDDGE